MEKEERRKNIGFLIIASFMLNGSREVVLGFNPETGCYVTWICYGKKMYCDGNFYGDLASALEDFRTREA